MFEKSKAAEVVAKIRNTRGARPELILLGTACRVPPAQLCRPHPLQRHAHPSLAPPSHVLLNLSGLDERRSARIGV